MRQTMQEYSYIIRDYHRRGGGGGGGGGGGEGYRMNYSKSSFG